MRYLIAFSPSDDIVTALSRAYEQTFSRPLPVSWLHLTVLEPFTINAATSPTPLRPILHSLSQAHSAHTQPTYRFAPPALFRQKNKTILHLPVVPKAPLVALHDQIAVNLADHVTFDLTPYDTNHLPIYLPHVTLDYKLDPNYPNLPNLQRSFTSLTSPLTFNLTSPSLYQEQPDSSWSTV